MRPTLRQLEQWNTQSINAAAAAAGHAAYSLDESVDAVVRAIDSARYWEGETHRAAVNRVTQEQDHANEVRNVLQQVADLAADAGNDLAAAQDFVLRTARIARLSGYDVTDFSEVTDPSGDNNDEARHFTTLIQSGLDSIGEIDTTCGQRIAALADDLRAMVNGQPDVTLPGGDHLDADKTVQLLRELNPDQRRTILGRLSPADIRHLTQADPQTMGNLDGVPFEYRITANETNIRNALAEEIQAGRGAGPRAQELRSMLTQRSVPYLPGAAPARYHDATAQRQFVAFDNAGNGRAVEMIGTLVPGVRNATVVVPGTGTNLNGFERKYQPAWNLAAATHGPVFVYMDGELPQRLGIEHMGAAARRGLMIGLLSPELGAAVFGHDAARGLSGSAVDTRFAAEMAPRLVSFGHELDVEVAQHSPGATTTYIGHSYGGSIVGTAEQLGLRADNIIHASSAGTGLYGAAPTDSHAHRYSLTFPGDLIQYTQSVPGNPHGSDPDSSPGITRLDTGTYERDGITHSSGVSAHTDYWDDPDSTAFRNMVKVITGARPDPYVEREPDTSAESYLDAAQAFFGGPGWHLLTQRDDPTHALDRLVDALSGARAHGKLGNTLPHLLNGGGG